MINRRYIAHVDMDAFFASVEQVLDPRLRMDEIGTVQQQVVALLSGTTHLQPEISGAAVAADAPPNATNF